MTLRGFRKLTDVPGSYLEACLLGAQLDRRRILWRYTHVGTEDEPMRRFWVLPSDLCLARTVLMAVDSARAAESLAIRTLKEAVRAVGYDHPLPRCKHGTALLDHAGEMLAPDCGCRFEG